MKRIALALAMLLVFGAGQAMASFDAETLIVNVYNNSTETGDTELAFDTGINLENVDWEQPFTATYQLDISTGSFASGTTLADLNLGINGFDATSSDGLYGNFYFASTVASTAADVPANATQFTSYRNAQEQVKNLYNSADGDLDGIASIENNMTVANSYDNKLNNVGDIAGYYGGLNATPTTGEINLAGYGSEELTMYLIGLNKTGPSPAAAFTTQLGTVATLTISDTGLLTVSNVPVPGAVWLLGSGLLGLLGIRRKNA